MRFKRITVENFGPFKNPTSIDFTERNGVSIVWGRNGRGKTTLLNAFNFVLNGTVKDRDGNVDNFLSFINEAGMDEGKYTFKVTLDLEDSGKVYRIVRSIAVVPGVDKPTSNSDLYTVLRVNESGSILSTADSDHFVKGIMTKEVSRFFLFDGELLTEYEELLNENSVRGGSIKSSIEQILGMPILTYGASDSDVAASTIATEARKVAQNEQAVSKYTQKLDAATETLEYQQQELQRLTDEQNACILRRTKFQHLVEDTEKLRQFSARKKSIEEDMDRQRQICEDEQRAIASILKDSWQWMISPVLRQRLLDLQSAMADLHGKEQTSKGQEVVIAYIQQAIKDIYCPVCDHPVSSEEREKLEAKISRIKAETGGLSPEEKVHLESYRAQQAILTGYASVTDQAQEIRVRYDRYVAARVKFTDLKEHDLREVESDLEALRKNATGADEKAAFEYFDQLGKVAAEIAEYDQGITRVLGEIEKTKETIKKLNATIIAKSQNKDVVLANKKVAFAEAIAAIFREGIDVYRDKLSRDVERDATEIFMEMNTEEDYGGLRINENYGLTIIRKSDGKPVPKRSAGWEHMVAFALIGALHKNAPFDGPVIMDSPFYRLDSINTESMVKALPLIANQVLMLPYPGEINPSTTRTDIGDHIVQELEIARISSNESTIKEMSTNG